MIAMRSTYPFTFESTRRIEGGSILYFPTRAESKQGEGAIRRVEERIDRRRDYYVPRWYRHHSSCLDLWYLGDDEQT